MHNKKCPFIGCSGCLAFDCIFFDGTSCEFSAQTNALEQLSIDIGSMQESLSAIATALNRIADKEG